MEGQADDGGEMRADGAGDAVRILLLDDNSDDRVLVKRALGKEIPAAVFREVWDAAQFADALADGEFDLVLTDFHLRWTNGLSVLRAAKDRWPDCPVVMITGTGSEEIAVEAMKAGLTDYVLKSPKHFVRLPATVAAALEDARRRKSAQETEVRFKLLFERVPVGLIRVTREGEILDANPALIEILGYPDKASLALANARDLYVNPGDRDRLLLELDRRGLVEGFETSMRRNGGDEVWVSLSERAVKDGAGRLVAIDGSVTDITGRKKAEQALRASEARFAKAFHSSPAAIALTTLPEFRILDVNERCCQLTGYAREEFLGRRMQDLNILVAPAEEGPLAAELLTNRRIREAEIQIRAKSGEVRDTLGSAEVIDLDGHPCALATFQDITDRKRAEEKLRSREEQYRLVTETVRDVIVTIDEQGRIILANKATERLLGYEPAELLGRSITEIIPERLRNPHLTSFKHYVLTGEKHVNWGAVEVSALHKDGREVPVEISFGEMVLEGRRVFTGAIRDVTERQAAERFRGEVLDVVSHEFRTPVTVIQGYAELMGTGALKPDSRAWHDARAKIERSSKHLGFLLTSIVELSKLREGGRSADPTRVKTIDLFAEAVTAMDARRPGPSRAVTMEVAPGAEAVLADRRMLLIALVEFLDNAAKYSPPDAPIVLRASLLDREVLIEVEDRGQGIPEHIRKDIFKPFVQADFSSVRKTGGVGLGLAVAHGLVKAQGGRVEVESGVGKGTTVRIALPRPGPA